MAAGLSSLITSATAITPDQLAVPGEEQRRFAFFRKGFGFIAESLRHVGFCAK